MIQPIVSLAGDPELHARASRFNSDLSALYALEDDLYRAERWNNTERFEHGFWGDKVYPPQPTGLIRAEISRLAERLYAERKAIVLASDDTVKPVYLSTPRQS